MRKKKINTSYISYARKCKNYDEIDKRRKRKIYKRHKKKLTILLYVLK